MGFTFQEFPNSDFYDSDLRELLKIVKELEDKYNCVLTKELRKLIEKMLSGLFINCLYDAEHERLKLFIGTKIYGGDGHIYDSARSAIEITEGENEDGEC